MLSRDLGAALQLLLPHQLLSRIAYFAMRWRFRPWKDLIISTLIWRYKVDMSLAAQEDPKAYPSVNAFFTRALKPEARPIADAPLVCPADGAISQLGPIRDGRILQAKGLDYSVEELLGGSAIDAQGFVDGRFATVYLSPRDYHRVHMPCAGRLRRTIHVPGRLFSVATWTTESIPRLFARNERLAVLFDTDHGPMAVVLVGAIFVSSIETVFDGEVTPPYADQIRIRDYPQATAPQLARGEELGRFNMGSTAIVLTGANFPDWLPELVAGSPVRMGQGMSG